MIRVFNKFLIKGDDVRTQKANLNIILSFLFRGGSILLQFALVPLTINYIQVDRYGVWITISSIVGWIALLDIGLANGLKNKLSEALANNDYKKAKIYVSSAYILISLFAMFLIVIYFSLYNYINWQHIFNSSFIPEIELRNIISIVFVFFLLKFVIDIINVVAASFQYTSLSSFLLFFSNLGLFCAVLILSLTTKSNLWLLALVLSIIPFVVSLIASIYLFNRKYKSVRPSLKSVDIKQSKGLLSLGAKFFILQVATLVIFQTDNVLIANLFNPKEVTVFSTIYKYYSVIIILFAMVMTPYWTAFTEAYFKKDFVWLKTTVKRLMFNWLLSLIPLIIMFILSKFIIKLWVGDVITVDYKLSVSIFFYVAIVNWSSIFGCFLNGVGKIRIQIICVIFVGLLNIPLILFLVKVCKWGVYAMPIANFTCLILGAIIGYIQYKKIVDQSATGIWNK